MSSVTDAGTGDDHEAGQSIDRTAANASVVRQYFTDLLTGSVDGVAQTLGPTCRVWVPGHLTSSGWSSRAEYLAGLAASGGGQNPLFATPVEFRFGLVTAQGEQVCVEAESHAGLTSGAEYNNQYHYLFRLQAGLIVEVKEYFDSLHVADVFALQRSAEPRTSNLTETTPGWN